MLLDIISISLFQSVSTMFEILINSQTLSFLKRENMQKQRQEEILNILRAQKYVTVKYLSHILGYSTATVNRDLNAMQSQRLIKRSYGGAEIASMDKLPPLPTRLGYMHKEKRKNAFAASRLVCDGDTIFLDASTTVQYIAPFLADKRNLTVITNNLSLAAELGDYDVNVICLGGNVVEKPNVLGGDDTVENALKYQVDKAFFSVDKITENGEINGTVHYLLYRVMLKNSSEAYLLTNKVKISQKLEKVLCDFSVLTGVVSDFEFDDECKKSYPDVTFINSSEINI